jgi:HAD superfamily hydrolase (TIGR01509 family)
VDGGYVVEFIPSEYSLIFDLHGVLVDTQRLMKFYSQSVADHLEADFAIPHKTGVTNMVGTIDAEPALEYGKRLEYLIPRAGDFTYPQTKEILTQLNQVGFKLYIASNAPRRHVLGITQGAAIESLFRGAFGRDDFGVMKSKQKFFQKLLEKIDSPPNKAIMVGDSVNEVIHPRTLGFTTILVLRETRIPPDVSAKANIEVKTLSEILPKLTSYFQ